MDVTPVDGAKFYGLKPNTPKSELNMETFLKLLTVQLANQNPLEPMNDRDFFAQMAQLGTVQGVERMNRSLDVTQAANLMGARVTAVRPMTEGSEGQNSLVTGTVVRLSVRDGQYWLGLQEPNGGLVEVRQSNIRQIDSPTYNGQ